MTMNLRQSRHSLKLAPLFVSFLSLFIVCQCFNGCFPRNAVLSPRHTQITGSLSSQGEVEEPKVVTEESIPQTARNFYEVMLSFRKSSETKKKCLEKARENANTTKTKNRWALEPSQESLIDELYSGKNLNRFSSIRYPFPLPSYRVKLAGLRRILEIYVADDDTDSTEDAKRTRALISILNQLVSTKGGVFGLEKEALKNTRKKLTMKDMLDRTPKLETPAFTTVVQKESQQWEIRNYDDFSVVSLSMPEEKTSQESTKPFTASGASAFNDLAGYIFGKNKEEEKMAMTTPVISSTTLESSESSTREMCFVMPSKFWGEENIVQAPSPLEDAPLNVKPANLASSTWAVTWFGGYCTKAVAEQKVEELTKFFENSPEREKWEIDTTKSSVTMQYNDPFQPPWKRRNEVAIPLKFKIVESAAQQKSQEIETV